MLLSHFQNPNPKNANGAFYAFKKFWPQSRNSFLTNSKSGTPHDDPVVCNGKNSLFVQC